MGLKGGGAGGGYNILRRWWTMRPSSKLTERVVFTEDKVVVKKDDEKLEVKDDEYLVVMSQKNKEPYEALKKGSMFVKKVSEVAVVASLLETAKSAAVGSFKILQKAFSGNTEATKKAQMELDIKCIKWMTETLIADKFGAEGSKTMMKEFLKKHKGGNGNGNGNGNGSSGSDDDDDNEPMNPFDF